MNMVYLLYDILLFLASLIYLPFYALRGRVGRHILMRLGFFKDEHFQALKNQEVVWIHAVSVGEARASESLIRLIRQQWPRKRLVVSCVTPTGFAIMQKILKSDEMACYAPLDISFVVRKFLSHIHPDVLIIMETEIWPNLIRLGKERGATVIVVNGRISDRSLKWYKRFAFLLRNIFRSVDLFCMQTMEAKERIIALGAMPEQVQMTGNVKFDISEDWKEPAFLPRIKDALKGSLLWVAASTHDNEEEMVVAIYRSLRKDIGSLRLLIAPRHLERVESIRRAVRLGGLEPLLVSGAAEVSSAQVMILDTIGDLNALYRLCDVAFIGGSLVKKGGHNPIEPALFGKAILFGRYMDNFREVRDIFIREEAAIEVDTPQNLEYELRRLLADTQQIKTLGDKARRLLERNRGAASRTFSAMEAFVR